MEKEEKIWEKREIRKIYEDGNRESMNEFKRKRTRNIEGIVEESNEKT